MHRQNGAALITALIFLVIITMLSLSSMRSSMLELRQAQNDEVRAAAFEGAQAVVDAILDTPANMPVAGNVGDTTCTPGFSETPCTQYTITMPDGFHADDVAAGYITVRVERLGPAFRPPPRGLGTSARMLTAAAFQIDADFDLTDQGRGQSEISQGVLIVVPRGQ